MRDGIPNIESIALALGESTSARRAWALELVFEENAPADAYSLEQMVGLDDCAPAAL